MKKIPVFIANLLLIVFFHSIRRVCFWLKHKTEVRRAQYALDQIMNPKGCDSTEVNRLKEEVFHIVELYRVKWRELSLCWADQNKIESLEKFSDNNLPRSHWVVDELAMCSVARYEKHQKLNQTN